MQVEPNLFASPKTIRKAHQYARQLTFA